MQSPTTITRPLRIHKQPSSDSSDYSSEDMDSSPSLPTRALAEVSSVERRRNSPSYVQVTRKTMGQDDIPSSSPFPSPYQGSQNSSPRTFWQGKLQENRPIPSPEVQAHTPSNRKVELERLKSQSRVSRNMFQSSSPTYTHEAPQTPSRTPGSVGKASSRLPLPSSNSKLSQYGSNSNSNPGSPSKSSCLAGYHMNGPRDFEGNDLLRSESTRGSKQVTFNEAPQVQMFEPPTPDPSVTSTERSYDTDSEQSSHQDDEDSDEYDELDDANIPVIGPEDWAPPSPSSERERSMPEVYRSTPSPLGSRPLPPLPPGMMNGSGSKLSPAGSRPLPTNSQQRGSPSPGPSSDSEAAPRRLTLEERLRLVMLQESPISTPEKKQHQQTAESPRVQQDEKLNSPAVSSLEDRMKNLNMKDNDSRQPSMDHDEKNDSSEDEGNESFSPVMTYGDSQEAYIKEEDTFELNSQNRQASFTFNEPEKLSTITKEDARSDPEAVLASEYRMPRISRESIRRQVQARRNQTSEESIPATPQVLETAVESTESSPLVNGTVDEKHLKLSEVAQSYLQERSKSPLAARESLRASISGSEGGDYDDEEDDDKLVTADDDDDVSKYSDEVPQKTPVEEEEEPTTPTQTTFNEMSAAGALEEANPTKGTGLPDLSFSGRDSLGLNQYMSPPSPPSPAKGKPNTLLSPAPMRVPSIASRKFSQASVMSFMSETGSVIRHPVYEDEYDSEEEDWSEEEYDEEPERERTPSPVPVRRATIRSASGMTTRKSATPADMEAMAAARRQVSENEGAPPPVPAIPAELKVSPQEEKAEAAEDKVEEEEESSSGSDTEREDSGEEKPEEEKENEQGEELKLSPSIPLPELEMLKLDVGMSDLSSEFNRVIEAQKRGYLMRQNTKVIHATSDAVEEKTDLKVTKDAHSQSWSVEPWKASNSPGTRRRSLKGSDSQRKKPTDPARQHHANAMAISKDLPPVSEDTVEAPPTKPATPAEEEEDNTQGERGRLFVKVVGVKDLALPLPKGEPTYFCMTLDNGLHCVTTSWLELGKNAPIGQEFELVVLDDLEFQLTLQTKLVQPPPPVTAAASVKAPSIASTNLAKVKSKSAFHNIFTSPKKRKEMERLQLLEQQQRQAQQAALLRQPAAPPTAWELLHNLVARDGSFSRSYVSLKDFESKAFGRPYTIDIPCFNEWAVEMSSVKGKKNYIKKAPYKIGKLEVQLMFVPKGPSMTDNDMPKSMNSAIRELKEAENVASQTFEGHLSQQGGDCPFWRRRYFKLEGCRLKAFHESTRQPRATINLSKAAKLIDDRNTLTTSSGSQKRRKSGFSEDEEGYMFVEEGFRIRFSNGECIDFYADSTEQKKQWMKVLNETIGRCPDAKGWCEMVLAKERLDRKRAEQQAPVPAPQPVTAPIDRQKALPAQPQTPKTESRHQRRQSGGPDQYQRTPTTSFHQRTQSTGLLQQKTPASRIPQSPRTGGAARPQSYYGGQFR